MATINAVNTSLSGQSGTGAFAGSVSPGFTTPNIGVATASSLTNTNFISATGTRFPFIFSATTLIDEPSVTATVIQLAKDGSTAFLDLGGFTNNTLSAYLRFYKSRNTTVGSHTIIANGDDLGFISFHGDDGVNHTVGAIIETECIGTPSVGIIPTRVRIRNMLTGGSIANSLTINVDGTTTLGQPLPVGSGGLGIATTPSNGQLPIGNGTNYVAATLTAGAGINIINGAGSIEIQSTSGGVAVVTIAGTSQAGAVNTKYIALAAGQTTLTLPTFAATGDVIALIGSSTNTGGWIVDAPVGVQIRINNDSTSVGGTVTSAALAGQSIYLECDVANTSWIMTNTVSTILTTS